MPASESSEATRVSSHDGLDASKSPTRSSDDAPIETAPAADKEAATPAATGVKAAPGAKWKDQEVQQSAWAALDRPSDLAVVHNRLAIVLPALAACVFLAAMDQTVRRRACALDSS